MRRIGTLLLLTAALVVVAGSHAQAANSVVIESDTFNINAPACTVGVYVNNADSITALVLAMEMRTLTGGAFISSALTTGNFKLEAISGRRVDASPLGSAGATWPAATVNNRKYPNPGGTCLDSHGAGTTTYQVSASLPDGISPDGFLYATFSTGDPGSGEDIALAPGDDPPGSPSLRFVFPSNSSPGTFIIDSACVTPANVCSVTDMNTNIIYLSFTPGVIQLGGSAVKELETGIIPQDYALEQNYPNPFNAGTVIRFMTPTDGNVTIDVYNILGAKVRTLVNEFRVAGTHQTDWDGRAEDGTTVATGVYFYRITAEGFTSTRKMVLLK